MSGRVLAGPRFVEAALASPTHGLVSLHVDATKERALEPLLARARALGIPVQRAGRGELDRLADGLRHQGVVALAKPFEFTELDELLAGEAPLLLALDEITDPHNFGAIVRSAVAFGVDGLLVPKHRSATVTPTVFRTSAGAVERARIAQVTNLQRTLLDLRERHGLQVVGLAGDGETTIDALPPAPLGRVLVVGSEGDGLRRLVRERCDVIARIPQTDATESLNASVATAVALYAVQAAARRA